MAEPRVVVIGAGIIGASLAYHLAQQGVAVTVLDAAEPGGLATRASFAWINASWGNPEFYFHFRRFSMQEWRRLDREIPDLQVNWCGGLCWDLPPDKLEAYAEEHGQWGYNIKRINRAAAQRIEPSLAEPPEFALYVAEEGTVEPVEAAQKLLTAAQARGAEFFPHTRVKWLTRHGERITGVMTQEGELHADQVVLAAGAGTVIFAGMVAGHGVVSVSHEGRLRTTYEPVVATVVAGQWVAKGAQIGTVQPGHAGCPVPVCLHWGAFRSPIGVPPPGDLDREYLDPLRLIARARVRLLPIDGRTVPAPGAVSLRRLPASCSGAGALPGCAAGTPEIR